MTGAQVRPASSLDPILPNLSLLSSTMSIPAASSSVPERPGRLSWSALGAFLNTCRRQLNNIDRHDRATGLLLSLLLTLHNWDRVALLLPLAKWGLGLGLLAAIGYMSYLACINFEAFVLVLGLFLSRRRLVDLALRVKEEWPSLVALLAYVVSGSIYTAFNIYSSILMSLHCWNFLDPLSGAYLQKGLDALGQLPEPSLPGLAEAILANSVFIKKSLRRQGPFWNFGIRYDVDTMPKWAAAVRETWRRRRLAVLNKSSKHSGVTMDSFQESIASMALDAFGAPKLKTYSGGEDDRLLALFIIARGKKMLLDHDPAAPFKDLLDNLELARGLANLKQKDYENLLVLKANCEACLGDTKKSQATTKSLYGLLKRNGSMLDRSKDVRHDLMNLTSEFILSLRKVASFPPTPETPARNKDHKALSDAVTVSRVIGMSSSFCITAKRKIMPGEILCVESPLVAVPLSLGSNIDPTCSHCLRDTPVLHSFCPRCPFALVCSKECALAALGSYHPYECMTGLLGTAFLTGDRGLVVSTVLLMLRALFSRPLGYYVDNKDKLGLLGETECDLDSCGGRKDQWAPLWRLDGSWGRLKEDRETDSRERKASVAVVGFAYELAKKAGYVQEGTEELVAALLCHFHRIIQLRSSLHLGVSKNFICLCESIPDLIPAAGRRGSLGIYPTAGLFRHSCLPNAALAYARDGKVLVVSTCAIEPREEVRFARHPNATVEKMPAEERRRLLRDEFGMDPCDCGACFSGLGGPGSCRTKLSEAQREFVGTLEEEKDAAFARPASQEKCCCGGGQEQPEERYRDLEGLFRGLRKSAADFALASDRAPVDGTVCDAVQLFGALLAPVFSEVATARYSLAFQREEFEPGDGDLSESEFDSEEDLEFDEVEVFRRIRAIYHKRG